MRGAFALREKVARQPGWTRGRCAAFIFASFILLATAALAAPKFPPLTGRVVDEAQILSPSSEAKLGAELATLEQQTGRQLVVATLDDLQGYEIEDYGYRLLRTWGIGRKEQDDGAILMVAPKERQVRIEVGYGLEPVLTDAMSSLIIQRAILPAFRAGRLEEGVLAGAEAVVRQISLPEEQAKAQVAQAEAQATRGEAGDAGGFGIPVIFAIIIVLWVLSGVMRLFGPRRRFGGSGLWWLLPVILSQSSRRGAWSGAGGWSGGGGWRGGGGFSGGGGSGGGGGASGRW